MKITINIKTDNAAFEDSGYWEELEKILTYARGEIGILGQRDGNLRDSNGNTVGNFKVTGR